MSSNQEAETSATPGTATRLDRINELYYGTILPEETIRIGRERIHWMCRQCRGAEVLDVGCSQGIVSILLAREGFSVTAIDSFPDAIAYARKEIAREAEQVRQRIELIETDLSAFATNKKFDTIILGEVVEHQTRPRQLIEHAVALLAPGGRIVLTTPFGVHPHPDHKVYLFPRDLIEMFQGLVSIESLEVVERYMQCVAVDTKTKKARPSRSVSLASLLDVTETGARAMEHHLHRRLDERAGRLRTTTTALAQAKKQVAELQKSIDAESGRRAQVEAALTIAKQRVAELEQALLTETNQRSRADAALIEARKRLADLEQMAASETENRSRTDVALTEAKNRVMALEKSLSAERDLRSRADAAFIQARDHVSDLERSLATETERRSRADAALVEARKRLAELEKLAAAETEQRSRADAALVRARDHVSALEKSLAAEADQRSRADTALLDARKRLAELEKLAAAEAERRLQADAAFVEAKNRVAALEKLLATEQDLRSRADAALIQARDHVSDLERSLATETDQLSRAERALIEAKGRVKALDSSLSTETDLRSQADAALIQARTHVSGLETSLAAETDQRARADAALLEARKQLTDLEKLAAEETRHRLQADAALIESNGRAAALEESLSAETAQRSRADTALIEARRQLADLEEVATAEAERRQQADAALAQARDHVSGLEKSLAAEADHRSQADAALLEARQQLADLERLAAAETEHRLRVNAALVEANDRVTALEGSLSAETDLRSQASTALVQARAHVSDLEKSLAEEADRLSRAEQALIEAQSRAAALEKSLSVETGLRSRADQAILAERKQVADLQKSLASETQQRLRADAAAHETSNMVTDLEAQVTDLENQRHKLKGSLATEKGKRFDLEQAVAASGTTLRRTEARLQQVQEHLDAAKATSEAAARKAELLRTQLKRQQAANRERAADQNAELAKAREALAKLNADLAGARHGIVAMEQRVHATRSSVPHRLGQILIEGTQSWPQLIGIPRRLLALRAQVKRTHGAQEHGPASLPNQASIMDEVRRAYGEQGHEAAIAIIMECAEGPQRAGFLSQFARLVVDTDPLLACELGRRAHAIDARPGLTKWLAFLTYDCGFIDEPAALVATLPADLKVRPSERNKIEQIKGAARARMHLPGIPPRTATAFEPVANSVLYVTSMALPFHTSGYTVRTQGLVEGLMDRGWSVTCVTRPGYPDDRADRLVEPKDADHQVERVTYLRLEGASAAKQGIDAYVRLAAKVLEPLVRRLRPAVIHAASNHVNGLPALIVARRLGIPFVYEVRGLWEYTAASRNIGWEKTERFALSKALETRVARNADLVLTLTPDLARELEARGIEPTKILLAPNSVDTAVFAPVERDSDLAREVGVDKSDFTIVYVGSLLRYEGLDDLVRAVAILASRGVDANLVIAGDGEARESLAHLATELNLGDKVKLVGRITHERARRYWSLADAVAFPRKPYPVCEIVSPLKPLEAMAMAIPMVVSDVAPLRELAAEGRVALVHPAGDPEALAECLQRLAKDPGLRRSLGQAARDAVQVERTWQGTAQRIIDRYLVLTGEGENTGSPIPAELALIAPELDAPLPVTEELATTPPVDLADQRTAPPSTPGIVELPPALAPEFDLPPMEAEPQAAIPPADLTDQRTASDLLPDIAQSQAQRAPEVDAPLPETAEVPEAAQPASVTEQDAAPDSAPDIIELPPKRNSMTEEQKVLFTQRLAQAYESGGPAAVRAFAERQAEGRSTIFRAYCLLNGGRCCQNRFDLPALREFAEAAAAADNSASTLRGVARAYYASGDVIGAAKMIDALEKKVDKFTERDEKLAKEVRGQHAMIQAAMKPVMPPAVDPIGGRINYILHNSLPYSSAGYATRSHGISRGVLAAGYEIRPYTRPGFPYDVRPDLEGQTLPAESDLDGIVYRRMFENGRKGQSEYDYIMSSADVIEEVLRQERPALVHAASNYVTSMPALIAARRLGLPFIYEVRGFWEITRSSREEDFQARPRFQLMRRYEALVAEQADAVITLTGAMKDELIDRGVDGDTISIAHNAVDPERFHPISRDDALAERLGIPPGVPVIGYVGSFVHYEGLDDLVVACGQLAAQGVDFRLLLVGDGAILEQVQELIQTHGIADRTIQTGRVPHEQVESYYSLITVAPFPRKPWEVCEKVSPLKPFEALAMEKVVVVSSVRALTEIIEDGKNGLVFEKGNTSSLADALRRCVTDPALCRRLGTFGRQWILEHRTWQRSGRNVADVYDAVLARHPAGKALHGAPAPSDEPTNVVHV